VLPRAPPRAGSAGPSDLAGQGMRTCREESKPTQAVDVASIPFRARSSCTHASFPMPSARVPSGPLTRAEAGRWH
jgi:hypothetical protein